MSTEPPDTPSRPLYQQTPAIITALILFAPLGLFLMWRYRLWSRRAHWIITGVLVGLWTILIVAGAVGDSGDEDTQSESVSGEEDPTDTLEPPEETETEEPTEAPEATETPDPTDVPEPTDELETYTLDVNASSAGGGRVEVIGATNLPDGALLRVSASRAHRLQGEEDIRAVSLAGDVVAVSDGEFSTSLQLDESDLLFLVGITDVVDVLSDSVTVCAEFQTGEDLDGQQRQPDPSVAEAVGAFGERLANSPQVKVFGSATDRPSNWLEVETSLRLDSLVLDEIVRRQGRAPTVGVLDGFCL